MIQTLLDIIAPESCLECGTEGLIWCEWCRLQHDPLPSRCFNCHAQTDNCATCAKCWSKYGLGSVYVFGEYKELNKQLITSLKFECKRHTAVVLSHVLLDLLPYFDEVPTLVYIPSVLSHVRQRGFDHTALITKHLAKLGQIPQANLLARTNNVSQVGASKQKRKEQIKDAFRLRLSAKKLPKHVILVDDVVTTGATLSEASKVLKKAGVKRVDAIVFAYSK